MLIRLTLLLGMALTGPVPAQATLSDVTCEDSARLKQTLERVLGAQRQGAGLRGPETMLEVWVTERSGDWVIVQSYANGTSCIVAMGADWQGDGANPA